MTYLNLITALKGGAGSGNFGHSGRPGKRGGSAGGGSAGSVVVVDNAKSKLMDRARQLGYSNVTFNQTRYGLQVIANKKSKPNKLDLYINDEGVVVRKNGSKALGFND